MNIETVEKVAARRVWEASILFTNRYKLVDKLEMKHDISY